MNWYQRQAAKLREDGWVPVGEGTPREVWQYDGDGSLRKNNTLLILDTETCTVDLFEMLDISGAHTYEDVGWDPTEARKPANT